VRVYLPATTTTLRKLLDSGSVDAPPITGFAVTAALREWYLDDDVDALEYTALVEAARASLRLLDADASAARRRVVIAAEVPDESVTVRDDLDRGVVTVDAAVPLAAVASVHVDEPDAAAAVARAAAAIVAADLGQAEAQERVDDAEGYELAWYANQEIGTLLELL
jgi:hypothetical protein